MRFYLTCGNYHGVIFQKQLILTYHIPYNRQHLLPVLKGLSHVTCPVTLKWWLIYRCQMELKLEIFECVHLRSHNQQGLHLCSEVKQFGPWPLCKQFLTPGCGHSTRSVPCCWQCCAPRPPYTLTREGCPTSPHLQMWQPNSGCTSRLKPTIVGSQGSGSWRPSSQAPLCTSTWLCSVQKAFLSKQPPGFPPESWFLPGPVLACPLSYNQGNPCKTAGSG